MSDPSPLALDNQLCFSLYRASRAVTRMYQPLLKELGLTYPQYLVMLVLWETPQPCAMAQLAHRLDLDSGTLTPLLRRLEQLGHLRRHRDPDDERRVLVTLTPTGLALEQAASTIPAEVRRLADGPGLDPESLKRQADSLVAALTDHDPAS